MLNRLKMSIYYCYRFKPQDEGYQEGVSLFNPPVARHLNVLPISGETILASGGELSEQYLKARLPANSVDKYYEKDRLYISKEPPEAFDPAEPQCTHEIQSVLIGHSVTEIIMKKLV